MGLSDQFPRVPNDTIVNRWRSGLVNQMFDVLRYRGLPPAPYTSGDPYDYTTRQPPRTRDELSWIRCVSDDDADPWSVLEIYDATLDEDGIVLKVRENDGGELFAANENYELFADTPGWVKLVNPYEPVIIAASEDIAFKDDLDIDEFKVVPGGSGLLALTSSNRNGTGTDPTDFGLVAVIQPGGTSLGFYQVTSPNCCVDQLSLDYGAQTDPEHSYARYVMAKKLDSLTGEIADDAEEIKLFPSKSMKGFLCHNCIVEAIKANGVISAVGVAVMRAMGEADGTVAIAGDATLWKDECPYTGTGTFDQTGTGTVNSDLEVNNVEVTTLDCDSFEDGTTLDIEWRYNPCEQTSELRVVDACCPPI